MSKKYMTLVLVLLVLVLVGGGYFWKTKTEKSTSSIVNPAVESVQSANPYNKTNPFSNIKINPFE